jgi:hypothetical protein
VVLRIIPPMNRIAQGINFKFVVRQRCLFIYLCDNFFSSIPLSIAKKLPLFALLAT